MNDACIIAVYFGPLPAWFRLWATSCGKNTDFDWLLVTDYPPPSETLPKNVAVLPLDLDEFKKRVCARIGFEPCIPGPYKICDFRPAYGVIFSEFLEPYRFWGFCDLDVIFGRLSRFLTSEVLKNHDRILTRGHLTLLRNTPRICGAYRWESSAPDYRVVFTNPRNYVYDEWPGLHRILLEHNVTQFTEEIVADINPNTARFNLTRHVNYATQAFIWKDGRVEQIFWDEDSQSVQYKEFPYIHFQKRKLACRLGQCPEDGVAITPHGFFALKGAFQSKRDVAVHNKPLPWWKRIGPADVTALRIFLGRQRRRFLPFGQSL